MASREMGCVTPRGFLFRAFPDFSQESFFFLKNWFMLRERISRSWMYAGSLESTKEATIAY